MAKDFWTIPRLWHGDTCAIIGGGPSAKDIAIEDLRPVRVIAVNMAFRLADWFDVAFYGDPQFPHRYGQGIERYPGLVVTVREEHIGRPGIKVVQRSLLTGLSKDPRRLMWNLNSGSCAINLATLLGAGKIILIGFDMQKVEGRNNYHDHYAKDNPTMDYGRPLGCFPAIARDLDALGVSCINTCLTSAIEVFPKMTLEEALATKGVVTC